MGNYDQKLSDLNHYNFFERLLLFDLFLEYWNASNTEIYNEHNSFFKRLETSSNLEADWRYNLKSLDELDQILSKKKEGLEELNPNLFWTTLKVGIYFNLLIIFN